MSLSALHLVIKVDADGATLVAGPTGWNDAQNKWRLLDNARRDGSARLLTGTYYMVRSMEDPAWRHLAGRSYPTREHAARAIARRLAGPGSTARAQRRALGLAVGDEWGGWHRLATAARREGLIAGPAGGGTPAWIVAAKVAELVAELGAR